MALQVRDDECIGCGACESACPTGAIGQSTGFRVAYEVDPLRCNDCGQCLVICPVDGLVADDDWAVCHGRGCPLTSKRYAGWECSEGQERCDVCGGVLWRAPGGEWACRQCPGADGTVPVGASCPKQRRAARLTAAPG